VNLRHAPCGQQQQEQQSGFVHATYSF
jgi:hypothetical protein